MVDKKGFIRTLEAVIAIILILGFIFYITPKVVEFEEKIPEDIANAKEFILNQILSNKEYTECIINANVGKECEEALTCDKKNEIIKLMNYIPYGYDYLCEICVGSAQCTSLPDGAEGKSIYTNTIFIYKPDKNYNIMRIYIWKK